MGRPNTGSSSYLPPQQPQNQSEYDLQPQEYHEYEAAHEHEAAMATGDHEYESNDQYVEENQPDQYQPQQPPQAQPPPQQQQPQSSQAYGAQPPRPVRMQQNNQMYQNVQNQPGAYPPPQGQQAMPAQQPVQFPPASPQNNQMFQNGAYQQHQQGLETIPPSPKKSPMFQNAQNRSPAAYPPQGPQHMQAQTVPVNFPPTYNSTPPGQGVQFQQANMQQQQQYVGGSVPVQGFPMQNPATQPMQMQQQGIVSQSQKGWSSGLFDFMNDPMNALVTALFPCLTFGQIAEIIDEGHTSCGTSGMLYGAIAFCIAVPCIMSCTYRTKLRSKLGLPEAPAPDWVTHFLCEWCALCQEYRELQSRGWDPSIGWQGNLARNQQQVAMMPPMNQRMMG